MVYQVHQVLQYFIKSNVSRNVFDLTSSPHTYFPRLFISCYWSLSSVQSFLSVAVFTTFTNISSSLTLLYNKYKHNYVVKLPSIGDMFNGKARDGLAQCVTRLTCNRSNPKNKRNGGHVASCF